ncbi:MAG TPA: TIGR03790 family protein [Candidatus Angelobacter sp.]|nr:TIGR03790 family protein [Candidatus Angelobacter sp.]
MTIRILSATCGGALILGLAAGARAAGRGDEAVVIYNSRMPESKDLAFYYAQRREVPTNQVLGFELPTTETMTRTEFRDELQKPLLKALERQKLLTIRSEIIPATREKTGDAFQKITDARIRYLTLCYGVPVKILSDPHLSEPIADRTRIELRRNEAAVDSELAAMPLLLQNLPLTGPARNPVAGVTNAALIHPTNGVLVVARLDGPSVETARGLVDKAMEAETNGLWGRAYFDLRGLTNTSYKIGDDWIRGAAELIKRLGFETVVDDRPETFSAAFPMSQIAFYAGWYDGQFSGPFTRPKVEFMPGALAYHLHSFSAHVLRSPDQYWAGPLLARGATATIGYVEEPYLEGTVNVAALFADFTVLGFTFGEAAYAAQQSVSWQTTVVGDPLYQSFPQKNPGDHFGKRLQQLHGELLTRKSPLIAWSHLQIVNLNLAGGFPAADAIGYLEQEPTTRTSAVLEEKLGDLFYSLGKLADAIDAYGKALKLEMTPLQRVRVTLADAELLGIYTKREPALELYQQFLKEFPDYPDPLGIYQKMLPLAQDLDKKAEIERIQKEIDRLTPQPAK